MLKTARLLSLLLFGFLANPALAESNAADTDSLPCNALCRRWMGRSEATAAEPAPVAAERQTVAAPTPVVVAPLPPPAAAVPRRPELATAQRHSPPVQATPPPAKPRRDQRTIEVRRTLLPAATPRVPRTSEAAARRPTVPVAAAVAATAGPVVVPPRAGRPAAPASPSPTWEVATAQPIAGVTHASEPTRAARVIDFVLPPLEQPPPPVIVAPVPARAVAFPPSFDVIATLLLTAPPRR